MQGGNKFCFTGQLIRLKALQHIALEIHGDMARLGLGTLADKGKRIVPAVGMEDALQQRRAQNFLDHLARHADLQRRHLLACHHIALHPVDAVGGDEFQQTLGGWHT